MIPVLMLGCTGLAGASEHAMPLKAPHLFSIPLPGGYELPFSNSTVMLFIAVCVIAIIVRLGTRKMELIPHGLQNVIEVVYEKLYAFVESILGPRLTKKYFWYFGSIFILILCSNYMGLLPGVGIITTVNDAGETVAAFRGANADMNTTMFLGFFFALMWFIWAIREQGIKHFLLHIFGPKGGMKGLMGYILLPIFFFVGLVECLSIAIRPIALGARLFGNIYGGEQIIEMMSGMGNFLTGAMCAFPFYLMELLIGFIQALVFTLLTAIFLKLQVGDGDEETQEEHA
jgi:F-type H+-transporting ATPase subunit a